VSGVLALAGQLRLVGAVLVLLGVAHLGMARAFGWPRQLAGLPLLTRQIVHAHTFFIGVTCALLGAIPLLLTTELLAPGRLPAAVRTAECAFWGLRWCTQFTTFRPTLWRGSRLYTTGHICFTLLWTWVVTVFTTALLTTPA
jgi:hypothetical protein